MKRDDVALEMREQYRRHVLGKTLILLGSLLLLLVLVIWSVSIGSADLTFGDVVRALLSRFSSRITVPEFNYDRLEKNHSDGTPYLMCELPVSRPARIFASHIQ